MRLSCTHHSHADRHREGAGILYAPSCPEECARAQDYVGPPGFVQDLATAHPHVHVVVLDHHKTAVALLVEPYQHLDKHQQLPTNVEVW